MARAPFDDGQEVIRIWRRRLSRLGGWTGWLLIVIVLAFYALGGVYTVGPAEVGLVKRFGAYVGSVGPGLHYHLPAPIESVVIVPALTVQKEEIGFRTISPPPNPRYREVPEEALMLTGDGNIVWVDSVVQYQVKVPEDFAFNMIDARQMIRQATEAVLREEVAKRTLDEVLTTERDAIARDAELALQKLLDAYGVGIQVVNIKLQDAAPPDPVAAAFDDVNSARQDKDATINEAQRYKNDVIPRAQGKAQQIIKAAEAYRAQQIAKAQGEVARFLDVLQQYRAGDQKVTQTRLYIEAMEQVLPRMNLVILTEGVGAGGTLKLLDLSTLLNLQGEGQGQGQGKGKQP